MDFLIPKYVKQKAKKGEIPALECSLLHHKQGRDADYVELRDAIEDNRFFLGWDSCSCCLKWACVECPLVSTNANIEERCCDGVYSAAKRAYEALKKDYSNANFKAFQDAEAKLCTYIEGVLEKKRAEKKEPNPECSLCRHQETRGGDHPCYSCRITCGDHDMFEPKSKKESTPALRHGEIRLWSAAQPSPLYCIIDLSMPEKINVLWPKSQEADSLLRCEHTEERILRCSDHISYPFDDLARNAEDLEEFEVNGVHVNLDNYGVIHFGGFIISRIDDQTKFHQNSDKCSLPHAESRIRNK